MTWLWIALAVQVGYFVGFYTGRQSHGLNCMPAWRAGFDKGSAFNETIRLAIVDEINKGGPNV